MIILVNVMGGLASLSKITLQLILALEDDLRNQGKGEKSAL